MDRLSWLAKMHLNKFIIFYQDANRKTYSIAKCENERISQRCDINSGEIHFLFFKDSQNLISKYTYDILKTSIFIIL